MQKGGLFEMGLLGATQGDPRRWAKNRGTELGVATVTDGGSVEVGNEFDKRLENAFMKSVKEMETEKEVSEEVIDAEAVEPAKRKVATTPSSPTDEEVARHNETHLPYRAWCKVCVQGKSQAKWTQSQASRSDRKDAGAGRLLPHDVRRHRREAKTDHLCCSREQARRGAVVACQKERIER